MHGIILPFKRLNIPVEISKIIIKYDKNIDIDKIIIIIKYNSDWMFSGS